MPAGADALRLAELFWIMLAGSALVWGAVMGLAVLGPAAGLRLSPRAAKRLIIWGGAILPTAAVFATLIYGLIMISDLRAGGGALKISVSGEQYWWRVTYRRDDGSEVTTANVLRLPRGERSELQLTSPDVIHSFWVPVLAGKLDMVPGRTNVLFVEPSETGSYRGQCAEFCGLSHAFMAFDVEVMEPQDFDAWLKAEAGDALAPQSEEARRGRDVFFAEGCNACHAIRGTQATSTLGPDLTHVANRKMIGAGLLETSHESLKRWIRSAETLKPGNRMPSYGMLAPADLDALAAYLRELK